MAQDVSLSPRQVIEQKMLTAVSTSTAQSIAAPNNAMGVSIQADGGVIRVGLGVTPTATLGYRLDDGQSLDVDSGVAQVRVISVNSAANVQLVFFDKP